MSSEAVSKLELAGRARVGHQVKIVVPDLRHIADIVELGREMWEDSQFAAAAKYNPAKCEAFLLNARARNDYLCLATVDDDGRAYGTIIAYITDYWAADGLLAEDKALFVTKSRRGALAAKALLNAYRDWAKANGCAQVYMNHTVGGRQEQTSRFFERMGFGQVGAIHVTNLQEH